jgi:hypothetical protein
MTTRVTYDELIVILLEIIPEDQTEFRKALIDLEGEWFNIAPELRKNDDYWKPIGYILEDYAGDLDTDWKLRVRDVYNSGGVK